MRTLLTYSVLLAACGPEPVSDPAGSVRERLSREPTILEISQPDSAGAITASRKTSEGWVPGLADLRIDGGELVLSTEGDVLALEDFRLEVGPIQIPETVLGYPLELTDIQLSLRDRTKVVGTWPSEDEAHGSASIELLLEWSLVNHGTTSPLGSPDLPPVPVELSVTGSGDHVHAEARVSAPGELWKWANVFRLEDLSLVISGDTP